MSDMTTEYLDNDPDPDEEDSSPLKESHGVVARARANPKKKSNKPQSGQLIQYIIDDGIFTPCIATTSILPDGVYIVVMRNQEIVFKKKNIYTDELLILPDTKSKDILHEIQRFWTLKDSFNKYGFLHKRGFLLHGPPGCGKTMTVAMVVKDIISKNGIAIIASDIHILSKGLDMLRKIEPERQIICILEDLDDIIDNEGESNLLALLDGEYQVDNIVYIATTNYPNKLDKRFINRPSRFDMVLEIKMPTLDARCLYFEHKLAAKDSDPKEIKEESLKFANSTEGLGFAHMRELIVAVKCLGKNFDETVQRLHDMKNKKPNHNNSKIRLQADSNDY